MKNITVIMLWVFISISSGNSMAQEINLNENENKYPLSMGYWGGNDIGFQLGVEKIHFRNEKHKNYSFISFLSNRKPDFYTGLGMRIGNTFRRSFQSGFFLEYGLFMGYLGNKHDFEVYRLNNQAEIINVGRPWFHSLIAGFSPGVGYDFSFKTNFNGSLFMKPNLFYKIPNNDNMPFINNIVMELGCSFDLEFDKKK